MSYMMTISTFPSTLATRCPVLLRNSTFFKSSCHTESQNLIQLYIRVSVVLSKSLCRKEREKLDITLDSMVVMLARV